MTLIKTKEEKPVGDVETPVITEPVIEPIIEPVADQTPVAADDQVLAIVQNAILDGLDLDQARQQLMDANLIKDKAEFNIMVQPTLNMPVYTIKKDNGSVFMVSAMGTRIMQSSVFSNLMGNILGRQFSTLQDNDSLLMLKQTVQPWI